ncbi:GNAT family N-acetyltransferase [Natrononativus amylolyticus]|uniref:GNAT family N-acetyltransferase n=1 Tax=Natrononativus amylolyticus TaxID=2963434 RepID=UPI0020CDEA04|nr:GNAT family N-acetyltransferase [Natrononativus amylolyticus]
MVPPSNPAPTIEPATEADIDAVVDCWVRLAVDQRAYGSHVLPEANRATMRDALLGHRFADGLLVARLDGDVVGFASFSFEHGALALDATRGVLSNLYVKPPYRDRGIGSALLSAVEDALAERGADVVALEAMATNEAARRFYRRAGYEPYRISMERSLEQPAKNDTHSREDG